MTRPSPLPCDRGVWLGALLLMLALIVGLTCGYVLGLRVERVSHRREVKAMEAQRDEARRDAMDQVELGIRNRVAAWVNSGMPEDQKHGGPS